jgi:hypothetical protein
MLAMLVCRLSCPLAQMAARSPGTISTIDKV